MPSTNGLSCLKCIVATFYFAFWGNPEVPHPCSKVHERQAQKQARRLQSLVRLLTCSRGCSTQEVDSLWSSILGATGFGKSFVSWVQVNCGVDCAPLAPQLAQDLFQAVSHYTNGVASLAWRSRQCEFVYAIEDSWAHQGGTLPFRLIKEHPLPPVMDLSVSKHVCLMPQRWSPYGLEWTKVFNPGDFQVGMSLQIGDMVVQLLAIGPDVVQVSSRLTRRQASELRCVYTTAEPADWVPHFLGQWER